MITKFSVKNFRSFESWLEFDLTTDKKYEFNSDVVEEGNCINHSMVYGENAQGKSNLGLAMVELTSHLCSDVSSIKGLGNSFLNANSDSDLAEFILDFKFDSQLVTYSYGKDKNKKVIYEILKINGQLAISLDRRSSNKAIVNLKGTETLKVDISDNVTSIITYVKNNSSLEQDSINVIFLKFIAFVEGMVCYQNTNRAGDYIGVKPTHKSMSEQIIDGGLSNFEAFLNEFGIECSLKLNDDGTRIVFAYPKSTIDFFSIASSGTIALTILYCWLERINDGQATFIYIDEFDAYYHHLLSKKIAKRIFFNNTQTVLSTHNTGIMSNDLLRPDCYFEIKGGLIKPLHELSDRELRKAHNLEKMYRSGVFNE